MRVGIDLDGVTVDFIGRLSQLHEEWFGTPVKPTQWDFIGQTAFESYDELYEWFDELEGWGSCPYIQGAPGAILSILDRGWHAAFVTARSGVAGHQTALWHRQGYWNKRVPLYTGMGNKSNVPCSVYIDDAPANVEQLEAAGKTVILFDQPWNQDVDTLYRAKGWDEVLHLLGLIHEGPEAEEVPA
jgi:5'-nucleotidase